MTIQTPKTYNPEKTTKRRKKYKHVQKWESIQRPIVMRLFTDAPIPTEIAQQRTKELVEAITTKVKQPKYRPWSIKCTMKFEDGDTSRAQAVLVLDMPTHCSIYVGSGADNDMRYETQPIDVKLFMKSVNKSWQKISPDNLGVTATMPHPVHNKNKWLHEQLAKPFEQVEYVSHKKRNDTSTDANVPVLMQYAKRKDEEIV